MHHACRSAQIRSAADAVTAAQQSGRSLLLQIDGGIGIGKTVFLADLLREVRGRHSVPSARVLHVSGSANSDGPFGALTSLIDTLLGAQASLSGRAQRSCEALAIRCAEALADSTHLLAVDDVDRLDLSATQFFDALITAPAATQLLLAVTHRPGHAPYSIIHSTRVRGFEHEHLTLAGLDDSAIETILHDLAPPQRESTVRIAQGNPMYARVVREAFLRHPDAASAAEVLRLAEADRSPVLGSAVASEIDDLPSDPRRLLEVLATIGEHADTATIGAVADMGTDSLREGIAELRRRTLLSEDSQVPLHPVIRHGVALHANTGVRADLRRRAVRLASGDPASRAEHLANLAHRMSAAEARELVELAKMHIDQDLPSVSTWMRSIPEEHRASADPADLVLARVLILTGHAQEARDRLETALRSERVADNDRAECRTLLAAAYQTLGLHAESRTQLEGLLHSGDDELEPALLRFCADSWALIDGEVPPALLEQLDATASADSRLVARIYRAVSHLRAGAVEEARVEMDAASGFLTFAADSHLAGVTAVPLGFAAWAALELERFDLCARIAARGLRIALAAGRTEGNAFFGACQALALAQLGRLDESQAVAEQARLDARQDGPQGAEALATTALTLVAQGRYWHEPQLLRARYEELRNCELPALVWWRLVVLTVRTSASTVLGAPEYSPELLRRSSDAAAPQRLAEAALAASSAGDGELASNLFREAYDVASRLGLAGQRAVVHALEAEFLLRGGNALRAKNLLNEAQGVFAELGMLLQQARASAALAEADRLLAREASHFEALTERELEVAELVIAGLKNREIAERLVISPRTAENHVARLLRKLQVENRQDLAARFGGGSISSIAPESSQLRSY